MKAFGFLPPGVRLLVTLVAIASGFGIGFWRFRPPAPPTVVVQDVVLAGVTSMPASETAPTSAVALQARDRRSECLPGRFDDEAGHPVVDELEWPARVAGRDDRLAG